MNAALGEILSDRILRRILLLGIAVHALAAWRTYGFYHFDEHFQLLEFANFKLGFIQPQDLAWEFHDKIRPTLQPTLAYGLIEALRWMGVTDPFGQATVLRFVSAILSLSALLLLVQAYFRDLPSRRLQRWLLGLSLLLWFIPFLNVRYSSETWSAAVMLGAIALLKRSSDQELSLRSGAALGGLLALAFLFRFQTAVMGLGVLAWLLIVKKERLSALGAVLGAGAGVVAIGLALDSWFYGEPTLAPWNYFYTNLIEGKAASFGTSPWWHYFQLVLEGAVEPIGALLLLSFLAFWILYPKSLITWASLPFFAIHLLIAHKELRFLFPLANLSGIVFVFAVCRLHELGVLDRLRLSGRRAQVWLALGFVLINAPALVAASVLPAKYLLNPARYISGHYGDAETILLYRSESFSPYSRDPGFLFYKPETVTQHPIDSRSEIEHYLGRADKVVLFELHRKASPPGPFQASGARCEMVKRTPQWVLDHLSFGRGLKAFGFPVFYECSARDAWKGPGDQVARSQDTQGPGS